MIPSSKRRGRPPKVVAKRRGRPPKKDIGLTFSKESEIEALVDQIEKLQIKVKNLEHQEIGWRAVVSYLEDKLGNSAL
jgi:hypothetical protein